jgi:hypothetical protein
MHGLTSPAVDCLFHKPQQLDATGSREELEKIEIVSGKSKEIYGFGG